MVDTAANETTNWAAIASLFCAGLAAAMQFSKLSPVMVDVGQTFAFGPVTAGLAISILGLVGVVFAISVGAMAGAAGLKRSLLLALAGGALFSLLGAFAPSGGLFLASRICEGFAHLTIVVCAPALMAAHANGRDRPVVMALWGCFFGLGFALVSAVAPALVQHFGWRGLMMAHAAFMAIIGAVNAKTLAGYHEVRGTLPDLAQLLSKHIAVYKSGAPLLIALTFCSYTILFLAVLTFLTRFLIEVKHWSEAATGSFMATMAIVTLCFTLMAGFLVRIGVPMLGGLSAAFGAIAVTALIIFGAQPDGIMLAALILLLMAAFGLVPGFVFANVPIVAPSAPRAALTYGAIAQFGNVGTFAGTPLLAFFLKTFGWGGGGIFVAVMAFAGLGFAYALNLARRSEAG